MINEIPETKVCPQCQINRRSDEYYVNNSRLDGLTYLCKVCIRKASKEEFLPRKKRTKIAGTEKTCIGCGRTLDAACFTYSQHEADKLRPACRTCCMYKGEGYPTLFDCEQVEDQLEEIYIIAGHAVDFDIVDRRAEYEQIVYTQMVKYRLTENWNPPIWIHKTSILEI